MKCDEQQPCKNKGICIENFEKGGSSCDCEHTSYYGDFCGLGKVNVILIFHYLLNCHTFLFRQGSRF